jgi:hypothetical protein
MKTNNSKREAMSNSSRSNSYHESPGDPFQLPTVISIKWTHVLREQQIHVQFIFQNTMASKILLLKYIVRLLI